MIDRTRSFLFVAFTTALASSMSLIGGLGLEHVSARILPIIPLIVALPGLNDLVGDYASIIAAHTGDPRERKRTQIQVAKAIFQVIGVNIAAILMLSLLVARLRGFDANAEFIIRFIGFVTGAACLTVLFMFTIAHLLELALRKHRINPDELLVPIITSVADILMLLMVTLAVLFVF